MLDIVELPPPPADSHPDANVLTEGFRTPLVRVGENAEAIAENRETTLRAFSPRNRWHLWLTEDIALMMLRLDRVGRMDRRQRDQSALRAEFFWDDDRSLWAEEVGAGLARNPARVVKRLRATPQGCDWLLERWGWLQAVLDTGKTWDEAQTSIAFNLLGVAVEFREAMSHRLADPAKLVRDQVAALRAQKAQVAESDALERSLAMSDMIDPATPEYRSLRQAERRTQRRMKWAISMLDLIPSFANPHPDFLEERARQVAKLVADRTSALAAARPADPPLPEPWEKPKPPAESPDLPPSPQPAPARSQRPDPAKLRAKTRSNAARQRREDRPDR